MTKPRKHIVIDARIRRASTGRPVDRLLEHIQELDNEHNYTILLQKGDDWTPKAKNVSVSTTRYPIYSFNLLNQLFFAVKLYRLRADLIHFTITPQQPFLYFGKQTTFTHDLTMLRFANPGKFPAWLHAIRMRGYRFLLWSAHRRASHIITPTQFVADAVNKYHLFTNRKTSVIYEASEPPLKQIARPPSKPPKQFIMYTGNTFPYKNIERLVIAFTQLKEHHPELKLVLVGKREWHSKKLERWASSKPFFDDIIFTGFIPDQELKWYYQNARAYVFASLSEGFGLPGLEAMVHGCPVVSSNYSCLPEVHGDAAHYFDPEDIQDISAKIDEVISNEKLRKKLIASGHMNVKRFSWRRFATQHITLFRKVLDES